MKTFVTGFPHGLQISRGAVTEEDNHRVIQLNHQISISPTSATKNS